MARTRQSGKKNPLAGSGCVDVTQVLLSNTDNFRGMLRNGSLLLFSLAKALLCFANNGEEQRGILRIHLPAFVDTCTAAGAY
ncbi:hypothetical protein NDU88_006159 [Pleurodeles waltl]|uniref:Uncharacterized protein n=1 Tax=Pleurodeles waltl TaxID=8319 RepID=A0AAV7QKY6_PLEWA|nr:hypothetical protein NDU88_006159 [Pleurodeles waltl]